MFCGLNHGRVALLDSGCINLDKTVVNSQDSIAAVLTQYQHKVQAYLLPICQQRILSLVSQTDLTVATDFRLAYTPVRDRGLKFCFLSHTQESAWENT
jgi:UDP-N-acetyl-D-mannosaminuronate dehydrogenase